jgi:uncharacterized repeat protein (TIGR02543 family)
MKKITSFLLALAMTLSLLSVGVYATATEDAPFTLSVKSQSNSSVVVSLNVSKSFSYSTFTVTPTADGLPEPTIAQGANYNVLTADSPTIGTNAVIAASNKSTNTSVTYSETAAEILTFTYDVSSVQDGTYTVTAKFTAASDVDDNEFSWENATTTVTIGTVDDSCEHTNTTPTEAQEPTCKKNGNIAYWYCSDCGKYFSDEACETVISQSDTVLATVDHVYENGKCKWCQTEQPTYAVSYKLYNEAGTEELNKDGDGNYLVDAANTDYIAKVFITSSTEQTLGYFDLTVSYDKDNVTVTLDDTDKLYDQTPTVDATNGTIRYVLSARSTDHTLAASTALQVAQFKFKVNSNTDLSTVMTFSFGETNEVDVVSNTSLTPYTATTTSVKVKQRTVTVTWDANEGELSGDVTTTIAYNTAPNAPADPTRTGYQFKGWMTSSTGMETVTPSSEQLTTDKTYYAKWEAISYSITYDLGADDATNSSDKQDTYKITDNYTLPTPTRPGYDFKGWTITSKEDATLTQGNTITALSGNYGNITVTAQWEAKTYNITYEPNGGSLGETATTATYKITDTVTLPEPTRTGYKFDGWKVTETKSTPTNLKQDEVYNDNNAFTGKYGDVTLTAVWTMNISYAVVTGYTYAPTGYQLLIVSAAPESGYVVQYDGQQMFHISASDATITSDTGDSGYTSKLSGTVDGADGVYVTLVQVSANDAASFNPTDKITFVSGTDVILNYNTPDIDGNGSVGYHDAFVVNEMVKVGNSKYALSVMDIQKRLLADVNHDCATNISDVEALITMVNGTSTNS